MGNKICNNFYKWLTWGLIGIIISLISCAVMLTGGDSWRGSFYDCGDVYEIRDAVYKSETKQEKGFQEKSGKVTLEQGEFSYGLVIEGNKNRWNHLCITVENISNDTLKATVSYQLQKEGVVQEELVSYYDLKEGVNLLEVPHNSFNVVVITFTGENGTTFSIEKIELREQEPYSEFVNVFRMFPVFFAIYALLSSIVLFGLKKAKWKLNLYSWVEILQGMYVLIAGQFEKVVSSLTVRKRRYIRRLGFLAIFLYSVFAEITQIYYLKFKYHLVVYAILLLIIAIVSIDSKIEKKNWNNPLVWGWIVFAGLMCVSDFLVAKDFRFWGYILLFVIGFYIFIWNNMKDSGELLKDFSWAVHAFLLCVLIFCVLFRPELAGARYSGISKNPSIFALYLGTIGAMILGSLDNEIRFERRRKRIAVYVLEGCAVLTLLWKSQSAGPLLCIAGIAFICIFRIYLYLKRIKKRKVFASIVLLTAICIVPVYGSITWGLNHIPQSLGSTMTFKGEIPVARNVYGMEVQAVDIGETLKDTRLGQKFSTTTVSGILSGRNYYWKAYLRNMNLVGHKERPVMWGHRRLPHNAILGIAYNYGVFTAVPYLIMLIAVIERTFKYSRRNVRYASMPFYVCLSSILMSMSDNVEQPFVWLPWMGLYFLMGAVYKEE